MANLNFKVIKSTVWVCICFCVLTLGYNLYAIFYRDYLPTIHKVAISVNTLVIVFVMVFVVRILRGINKRNQVFIPKNHHWLICAASGLLFLSYVNGFIELYRHYLRGIDVDWFFLIIEPLKPNLISYLIGGLLLLIIAYLYKLGTQAVEEQRLTI